MAATSHPLATQAAIDTLKAGGNALDAAIAACAVQCVVEPGSTGIGGDCFALYSPGGTGTPIAFNGSGRAPAAATPKALRELGVSRTLQRTSPHSVTVPGAVDAWCTLNRDYGTKPLAELLAPAISYARNGYPISSRVAADFRYHFDHLKSDENLARIFLKSSRPPNVGELHDQPGLADALELIGREGRSAFYAGELAHEMVDTLRAKGGLHTLDDFAHAHGTYVTPISTEFRGHTIWECPPAGQGVIALLLLNIMQDAPIAGEPLSAERIHFELEACRRAYAARTAFLGDPDHAAVPVDALLDKDYAAKLHADINPDAASQIGKCDISLPRHEDTVYITVVDRDRNACSFINTLFWGWGSGITTPRHGIVLTNRGQSFGLEEGHANCIAPRKRPRHTVIPGIVQCDGQTVMSFGVMGGEYQAMGHQQFLTRFFDYGLDIQEAQDLPRFMVDPFTGVVAMERSIPDEVVEALRAKGHVIERASWPIGGSQAIWIDPATGVLTGGSDPRKDGCAMGY